MHEEEELSAEARRVETGAATAYRADRVHLHEDPLQCDCRLDRAEVGNQGGGDPQSERAYRAKLERRRYIHTHKCIERMRRRKNVLLTGNSSNHIIDQP